MKKRLLSAVLALCLALPFPALAEEASPQSYEEIVENYRQGFGYYNERAFEAKECTVFVNDYGGMMNAHTGVMRVIYKPGSQLGEGTVIPLPYPRRTASVVCTPADTMELSGDGKTFTYAYYLDNTLTDPESGEVVREPGLYVYTVDLVSGEVAERVEDFTYQNTLHVLTNSQGYTVEQQLETPSATVVLRWRNRFPSEPEIRDYELYLIRKSGQPAAQRLLLPSTAHFFGWYAPTDRGPEELSFNEDGSVLTYVYRFDDALYNAAGELLHDAGTYTYRVDAATGELKVEFEKAAGAEGTTFVDVAPGDWFAPYVDVCAEEGLMNGVGEGKFAPKGVLNGDEALVMAARVLLKANGETEFPKGPDAQGFWDWAGWNKGLRFGLGYSVAETQSYVDSWCWDPLFYLAQAAGPELFSDGVTYACSRNTFFKALAFASQGLDLPAINDISSVPGTQDEDILRLYRAGILSGADQSGSFAGQRNLTRAEAAAALARIIRPELRMRFQPSPSPYQGYTLTPLMDVESVMENYPVATIFYFGEDDRQAGGILTLDGSLVDYPEGQIYSSGVSRSYDYVRFSVVDDQWNYKSWLIGQDGHYVPGSGKYQHLSATGDGRFLASQGWSDGERSHTAWYLLSPDGTVETELPEPLGGSDNNWYGFDEGVCPWQDEETGLWGYVDAQGNWVMEPTWAYASAFEGGYAVLDDDQGQCAVIDRGGNLVIPFQDKRLDLPRSSPGYEGPQGLLYWEDWRTDNKGLMDLEGTVYSLPDTVSSAAVYDKAEGGSYYLDSQARRISETFDRCGDLTPEGQGFVELGGKLYRIQFERK